jgi:hypothetical protein
MLTAVGTIYPISLAVGVGAVGEAVVIVRCRTHDRGTDCLMQQQFVSPIREQWAGGKNPADGDFAVRKEKVYESSKK